MKANILNSEILPENITLKQTATTLLLPVLKIMKSRKLQVTIGLMLVLISIPFFSAAEGTRQLEPYNPTTNPTEVTKLHLTTGVNRVPFAQIGCAAQYRLNIHISDPSSEKIYFGLNDGAANLYYRLRSPSGGTPIALTAFPTSGTGFISTWNQAYNGPNIGGSNPSGYTPMVVTPTETGDYYIEFASSASGGVVSNTEIEYIDVTVATGTTPINGRLWSQGWQIYSGAIITSLRQQPSLFQCFLFTQMMGLLPKLT